jgi:hypothetical protein
MTARIGQRGQESWGQEYRTGTGQLGQDNWRGQSGMDIRGRKETTG